MSINDSYLQQFKAQLPTGWLMKMEHELLQIIARQDCYVLFENKINAPLSRKRITAKRTFRKVWAKDSCLSYLPAVKEKKQETDFK